MEENDDILLFDDLEEIEDPQGPLWILTPFIHYLNGRNALMAVWN
jgi:hypothetical protein